MCQLARISTSQTVQIPRGSPILDHHSANPPGASWSRFSNLHARRWRTSAYPQNPSNSPRMFHRCSPRAKTVPCRRGFLRRRPALCCAALAQRPPAQFDHVRFETLARRAMRLQVVKAVPGQSREASECVIICARRPIVVPSTILHCRSDTTLSSASRLNDLCSSANLNCPLRAHAGQAEFVAIWKQKPPNLKKDSRSCIIFPDFYRDALRILS